MGKTIVVPLDGSPSAERAAPIAAALARRWNADLLLTTVGSGCGEGRGHLEQVAEQIGLDDVPMEAVDGDDVPGLIQRVVSQTPDPVVCMATQGHSRVGSVVLGSVAETLLRQATCPFVLIGPHCAPTWPGGASRMLACLDESATSGAILAPASDCSKGLGLELWLAEVFHPLDVDSAREPYRFLDTVVARLRPELPDVRACAAWSSYIPGEIIHLADTLAASMIAMGTHGRSGLARLALGSVTMAVVHRAACPVLTTRPGGLR